MYLSRQFLLLCFFIFLCGWRLPRKSRLVTAHERPFLNLNFSQKFPNFSQKFPNKIQKFQKTNQPKNRLVHPELWVVHFWKVSKKCLSPKAFVHVSDTCNDLSNPRVSNTKERPVVPCISHIVWTTLGLSSTLFRRSFQKCFWNIYKSRMVNKSSYRKNSGIAHKTSYRKSYLVSCSGYFVRWRHLDRMWDGDICRMATWAFAVRWRHYLDRRR